MLKQLFWEKAGIEIQPDGTQVQKWQRRRFRLLAAAWLIQKLAGGRQVLVNLTINEGETIKLSSSPSMILGCRLDGGRIEVTRS